MTHFEKHALPQYDLHLSRGPNYGDTLTWDAAHKPLRSDLREVHIAQDLDTKRFYELFVQLMQAPPHASPPLPLRVK